MVFDLEQLDVQEFRGFRWSEKTQHSYQFSIDRPQSDSIIEISTHLIKLYFTGFSTQTATYSHFHSLNLELKLQLTRFFLIIALKMSITQCFFLMTHF